MASGLPSTTATIGKKERKRMNRIYLILTCLALVASACLMTGCQKKPPITDPGYLPESKPMVKHSKGSGRAGG